MATTSETSFDPLEDAVFAAMVASGWALDEPQMARVLGLPEDPPTVPDLGPLDAIEGAELHDGG